jgi:hypothetical protein
MQICGTDAGELDGWVSKRDGSGGTCGLGNPIEASRSVRATLPGWWALVLLSRSGRLSLSRVTEPPRCLAMGPGSSACLAGGSPHVGRWRLGLQGSASAPLALRPDGRRRPTSRCGRGPSCLGRWESGAPRPMPGMRGPGSSACRAGGSPHVGRWRLGLPGSASAPLALRPDSRRRPTSGSRSRVELRFVP